MQRIRLLFSVAVGKKLLMAVTGLGMIGFLIAHLTGNLLLFSGNEAFNEYAHMLVSNPLIYVAEAGLIGLFVVHVVNGIGVTKQNRAARPIEYHDTAEAGGPSRKSPASSTMIISGLALLAFVPLHVWTMKFGAWYEVAGDPAMRDLKRLVVETFTKPAPVLYYCIALVLVGLHAWHGFGSAFESLGANSSPALRRTGQALAAVLTVGFLSIPLAIFLTGGNL